MTEILSSLCYNQLFTNHSQLLFSHSVIVFLLTLLLLFFSSALFQALRKGILGFQFIFVSIVQFSRCKRLFSHSLLKFSSRFLYRCNSFIIPHFLKFVKRFFKTFFKVFLLRFILLNRPQCSILYRFCLLWSSFASASLYPLHYSSFNVRFSPCFEVFCFSLA